MLMSRTLAEPSQNTTLIPAVTVAKALSFLGAWRKARISSPCRRKKGGGSRTGGGILFLIQFQYCKRERIDTFVVKGIKTERRISSGFRHVFPKPTKKSLFKGTSRLPPGGSTKKCWCFLYYTFSMKIFFFYHTCRVFPNIPSDITLTLLFPAARTGFRSEFG